MEVVINSPVEAAGTPDDTLPDEAIHTEVPSDNQKPAAQEPNAYLFADRIAQPEPAAVHLVCRRCGSPLSAQVAVDAVVTPLAVPSAAKSGLCLVDFDVLGDATFTVDGSSVISSIIRRVFCERCEKDYYVSEF